MLDIKKILLPVDYPNTSLSVIHQAAALAHHFHSEIVMLHAVTPRSHAAGVPEAGAGLASWDLLEEIIRRAQETQDQTLGPEVDGLTIRRVLAKGNPAQAIVQTAQREKANLIMMPSYGFTFDQFLLSSLTPKVLGGSECPLWTCGHAEQSPPQNFVIRNVVCAVDFSSHVRNTVSWAKEMADEFGASLTLADVTASVEFWGPGGDYVNPKWKAGESGLAGDWAPSLRRVPAHARLCNYSLSADSSSERRWDLTRSEWTKNGATVPQLTASGHGSGCLYSFARITNTAASRGLMSKTKRNSQAVWSHQYSTEPGPKEPLRMKLGRVDQA
jgi:nucleotide-binding universal stress UspA family protein